MVAGERQFAVLSSSSFSPTSLFVCTDTSHSDWGHIRRSLQQWGADKSRSRQAHQLLGNDIRSSGWNHRLFSVGDRELIHNGLLQGMVVQFLNPFSLCKLTQNFPWAELHAVNISSVGILVLKSPRTRQLRHIHKETQKTSGNAMVV